MNRLATIFSIVTTAGILLTVVSGVAWIITALQHRETVAKALCIFGILVAAVGFAIFLRSYDSSLHQEPQDLATKAATSKQPQEPAQEPIPAPSDGQEVITLAEPQKPTRAPQEPAQAAEMENPLTALQLQTRPVMNGLKTEQIGTWAYIETTKEFMAGVTAQQLHDYLTDLPVGDYNWFNVFFEDGTGLWTIFPEFVEYGEADRDEGGGVEYIGDASDCIYTYADGQYSTEN